MLGEEVKVVRNDEISIEEINRMNPEMIVLSPGPCTPDESGICKDVVNFLGEDYPILGICLGFQTIAQIYGAKIIKAPEPVHGKVHAITHDGKGMFRGLKNKIQVTRYHSLIVERETIPDELLITAQTADGIVMGVRHKNHPIAGVQFHPEALLTEYGMEMIGNFLEDARRWKNDI
jgi:anthranilate synthase/aminodeoxychorismate synthase-like glutamine amidotransferase